MITTIKKQELMLMIRYRLFKKIKIKMKNLKYLYLALIIVIPACVVFSGRRIGDGLSEVIIFVILLFVFMYSISKFREIRMEETKNSKKPDNLSIAICYAIEIISIIGLAYSHRLFGEGQFRQWFILAMFLIMLYGGIKGGALQSMLI